MFKKIFLLLFQAAVYTLLMATILGYFAMQIDFAEYIVSFRPLLFVCGLLAFGITVFLNLRPSLLFSLAVIVLNGTEISPYLLPAKSSDTSNLTILFYNVDKIRMPLVGTDEVIELVEQNDPDLAILREVGKKSAREISSHFEGSFPYQFAYQHAENDGVLILSRFRISDQTITQLGGGRQVALANLSIFCQKVHLVAPHPNNPFHNIEERNQQLHAIALYLNTLEGHRLVVGDLNVTMWSGWYKQIEKTGLTNVRRGHGIQPSWRVPGYGFTVPFVYFPLDHILINQDFEVYSAEALPSPGSDHQPLLAKLWIRPNCA